MSWLLVAKLVGASVWESAGFLSHSLDQLFDKSSLHAMNPSFDPPLPPDCPPVSATSRFQDAFRIVKCSPPTLEDFQSYAQLGLAPNVDQCRRLSLSIYDSFRQANHRKNLTPRLGDYVAHAKLTEEHGLISLPNHQGHMEWWAFAGMVKPEEFKVVSGEHSA